MAPNQLLAKLAAEAINMREPASGTPDPLSELAEGIQIEILVQPKAKRTGLIGLHAGRIKIAVTEAPEGGKANAAVINFLAKQLGVSKSSCCIRRGHSSRTKTVVALGVGLQTARRRLGLERTGGRDC